MKRRKVVSDKNTALKSPLWPTLVTWLTLDRFAAPGWLYGILGTLFAIYWICWVTDLFNREEIEIFKADS